MRDNVAALKGIWFMVHLLLLIIVGWLMLKYKCQPIVYVLSMVFLSFVGVAGYIIIHNKRYE